MEDAENNFFKKQNAKEGPLISVIIPCYNHELYLGQAIESALSQTFPNVEIIIVDDGSSDDSAKIAKSYHQVIYFFQENQGSSAARNTGIILSQGDYIVFLDADDYLLPEALQINYQYLKNTDAAFVFGTYRDQYEDKSTSPAEIIRVDGEKFYYHLLRYNYIGMISTVMFQKWIFECFKFDVRIRGHEDHDLYLQIARDHLIIQHTIVIAVYRRHPYNTSNNITMMSADALKVLKKQKRNLRSKKEKMVYILTYISLYQKFFATEFDSWPGHISVFRENRKSFYILKALFIFQRNLDKIKVMKTIIKNRMSNFIKNKLYKVRFFFSPKPRTGKINQGDLNRKSPFSIYFGYDRGGAIDRYYIENFIKKESKRIHGSVLEIGDNYYTMQYGGKFVRKSEILHVDESNKNATIIGDISNAPQIPENTFDCLILTQTLHLIYNFKEALQTCHRILKPGGTLLLTVPGITPIDHDEWNETWYWSFTDKALKRLLTETFPESTIEVNCYGNVYVASSFLYGMGLPEISQEKLDYIDPHFQVIITVKAIKK